MPKPKDDAYFISIRQIADLLVNDQPDDAAHGEADSKVAALAGDYGLSYTAVLKNVLQRVRFQLASSKRTKSKS